MQHIIVELEREKWQGYELGNPADYISHDYYDVEITRTDDNFNVSFIKECFDVPYKHDACVAPDKIFNSFWEDIKAWGIIDGSKLFAVIETSVEKWNNRLRVTELWVDTGLRRQGIATRLMDMAIIRARQEKRRAVILETQSHNTSAIGFYLNYGFTLNGFDSNCYRNNDLERKEVRMELGIIL